MVSEGAKVTTYRPIHAMRNDKYLEPWYACRTHNLRRVYDSKRRQIQINIMEYIKTIYDVK